MYPLPVERWKPINRTLYKVSLPIALVIWLLPMLAVLVTSIRSSEELTQGDYWGWPKHFALFENYGTALAQTPMLGGLKTEAQHQSV
ncbi:ABC-type sugar transport system, permease component [Caballeronia sordidicola]|uniref:ABC-type sugar transport system, permease component n=1 Tax=Caballeronia sordidicola TaxID=196367 RepID=A0A242N5F8_CABSO|nr:ABC-type sugar transport system, permease component [Caballeronia sordidicola]